MEHQSILLVLVRVLMGMPVLLFLCCLLSLVGVLGVLSTPFVASSYLAWLG
jgi:hypothetical protein